MKRKQTETSLLYIVIFSYLYQCFQIPSTLLRYWPNNKNFFRLVTNPSIRNFDAQGGPRTEESLFGETYEDVQPGKSFGDKIISQGQLFECSRLIWSRRRRVNQAGLLWRGWQMMTCCRLIIKMTIMIIMVVVLISISIMVRMMVTMLNYQSTKNYDTTMNMFFLARVQLRWRPGLIPKAFQLSRWIEAPIRVHKLAIRATCICSSPPAGK